MRLLVLLLLQLQVSVVCQWQYTCVAASRTTTRLRGEMTTAMARVVGTLPDIASVVGAMDQINRVVSGQGNVGHAADESRCVLVQGAEYNAVHAACSTHDTYTASVDALSDLDACRHLGSLQ